MWTIQRVLVVEDESLVREMIVDVLTEAGFEVDEASTGDDAAKLIDADGYSLILTDVQMPGRLDGIDLAAHARERKPGIPILFVTGRPDIMRKVKGAARARVAVLTKPYSADEIVKTIRGLLASESGEG